MLAAVQGFVLKHLLFGGKKGDAKKYNIDLFLCGHCGYSVLYCVNPRTVHTFIQKLINNS